MSESEIGRWERGESLPAPDDVDRYALACRDTTLWHRWMRSHYDSYRRMFGKAVTVSGLSASLAQLRYEMNDVADLFAIAERDGIDGKIDDPLLLQNLIVQLQEMQAAATDTLQKLGQPGTAGRREQP